MLLIIFLGLISTLTSFCDGCDFGTHKVKDIDWNKVRIRVYTRFLKYADFKTAT
jgi:hypothetical protein